MTGKPIVVVLVCALAASFFVVTGAHARSPHELTAVPAASPGSPSPTAVSPTPTQSSSPSPSPSPTPTPSPSSTVLGEVTTSIEPHPRTVRAGSPLELAGTVHAGNVCFPPYTISLQRRGVRSTGYKDIATVIAGADQSWTYKTAGRYNASYRAFAQSANCTGPPSDPAGVLVKARIHLRKVPRCRSPQPVRGWVQPKRSRERVVLQVRARRRWRTIKADALNHKSRFTLIAPDCDFIYRIVWPVQDARNEQGRLIFKLR
ncbi:MAG: hypothetical protein QOF16_465 [Actinomycetota bacterium]|nr:hypothetical protein [Actinomycetota bacterium]